MPLVLRPITENDTLSWTRIRTLAYYGPLHVLTHTKPISESSIRRVSEDRKQEVGRPDVWPWKVVDTDLPPGVDDPRDNGGQTIAIAVWRAHNLPRRTQASDELGDGGEGLDSGWGKQRDPFVPPELRLDLLTAVLEPLHAAQHDIMGAEAPYLELDNLATHPEHQRRGAGRILLDWGVRKANEEGWRTYLDATPAGLKVYERIGFKLVKEVTFDRGKWGGEGEDWWGCMVKEPGARKVNG
ncbi:hypothetical protein N0V90_006802 [Kalmusia sp. IMI 367209]|nr:hypothetical protein N0V90_006802 [Kalmusia sp. IMI 367209]